MNFSIRWNGLNVGFLLKVSYLTGFAQEGGKWLDKISWKPIQKEDLPHNYEAMIMRNSEWKMGKIDGMARIQQLDEILKDVKF